MDKKQIVIVGGGTSSWVSSHLALSAPAYGNTARQLAEICRQTVPEMNTVVHLTRMCDSSSKLETNDDISKLIDQIVQDDITKIVFFTAAMVDFDAIMATRICGRYTPRLDSKLPHTITLQPAEKVIAKVRAKRKDIFLVGFKQTFGKSADEQYVAGLDLLKRTSCNLVLANDSETRMNMVITPEEARYHSTTDRDAALRGLVDQAKERCHCTFTQSTVVNGSPVPWDSTLVPNSLRTIVNHCINGGAYKQFRGSTVGHFACKLTDTTFLTSRRRTDFNQLADIGLVKIETDGPDTVLAYGAKPSVGGQSQRIVFRDHPGFDCIVHFHCPMKIDHPDDIPIRSQYEFECGSHQCGQNTSDGLKQFGNLKAVFLDEHGPNIVFPRDVDPQEVIDFIDWNFDLSQKTGGFVSIAQRLRTPNTLETLQALGK